MTISPTVWANRFDPTAASVLLRDGPILRSVLKSLPWSGRATVAGHMMTDHVEEAVGSTGLEALLRSSRTACHTIRGGTLAEGVDRSVRTARGVLTVALLGLDGEGHGKQALAAADVFSAAVLLLTAEPGLQGRARAWIAEGKSRTREIGRLDNLGIGAALLSAHMSGPAFPEDILPSVAGDLLREVAR